MENIIIVRYDVTTDYGPVSSIQATLSPHLLRFPLHIDILIIVAKTVNGGSLSLASLYPSDLVSC